MQAKKSSRGSNSWFDGGPRRRHEELDGYARFSEDEEFHPWFDAGESRQNEGLEGCGRPDTGD